jgi:hypothetical protein
MTSTFGFPWLDCKGVNDLIGLPISVDGCCPAVLVAIYLVWTVMYPVPFLSKLRIELFLDRLVDLTMQYPPSVLKLQFSSNSLEHPVR